MARKKILWLCSWYPDKGQPFNGDFVQRHARAAALFNDVYVLHVVGDQLLREKKVEYGLQESAGLTERIIYYRKPAGLLGKWRRYYRWLSVYNKALRKYMAEHGKPALVHVHVPMRDGIIAVRFKKKHQVPFVITEHWTIYQPQNEIKFEQRPSWFRSMLSWIVRNSTHLLPVSNDLGRLINNKVAEKPFTVLENVADANQFFYSAVNLPVTPFRFLHVSNMSEQKNVEAIISCFKSFHDRYPAAQLILVGNVPEKILELITETGLSGENIFLTGEISYAEVAEQMRQAHALVMFSRYENSPCSIIEALCCGLPIIAPAIGGIPELIDDSNGLLIEAGDEKGLIAAFEKMVDDYSTYDPVTISAKAQARFSYPVIGEKLDIIYEKVIGEI